jgi:hypothetical protein
VAILLPTPEDVMEKLLRINSATLIRASTGTALDRKTLAKVKGGRAAERTMARLADDFRKRHPTAADHIDKFRERRAAQMAELGLHDEFEIESSVGTWRMGIEGVDQVAAEAQEPQLTCTVLRDRLLPLEDASIRATALWRKGDYDQVLNTVETCALAPFVNLDRLRRDVHRCTGAQSFADALQPVRALACLYLLAVFERQFYKMDNNPGFAVTAQVGGSQAAFNLAMRLAEGALNASRTFQPCFRAVSAVPRRMTKMRAPSLVRKQPEIFILTLAIRPPCSATLLVNGTAGSCRNRRTASS